MTKSAVIGTFLLLAATSLATLAPPAQATSVSPMVIDLQTTGRNVVANVAVSNTADKPLTMEVSPILLTAGEKGLEAKGSDADDLLVTPPTALIPPGRTQNFRVQWVGDPAAAASHHYYVAINQLPVKLPEGQSQVQIIYNFQVLVSVGPASGKAALAITSAQVASDKGKPRPAITVTNTGSTYGYLSQHKLRLVETDAGGKAVFDKTISGNEFQQLVGYGIVATGQTRTVVFPIDLPSASGSLTATLLDEHEK